MDTETVIRVRFTMNVVCFSSALNSVHEVRIKLLLYLSQFKRIIGTKDFSTVPKTVCHYFFRWITLETVCKLSLCIFVICAFKCICCVSTYFYVAYFPEAGAKRKKKKKVVEYKSRDLNTAYILKLRLGGILGRDS